MKAPQAVALTRPPAPSSKSASPKRKRTREIILAAGARLMSERSIDGLTIDDITQAADVAKGTFYNHFTDKDALAREIARDVRSQFEGGVSTLNAEISDPAMRIARGMCFYARVALKDPVKASLMAQAMPRDLSADMPKDAGLGLDIAQGISTGRFRVATRDSAIAFVLGAGAALILRLISEQHPGAAVMFAQQVVSLTLRGLGVEFDEADRLAAQAADNVVRD